MNFRKNFYPSKTCSSKSLTPENCISWNVTSQLFDRTKLDILPRGLSYCVILVKADHSAKICVASS